MIASKTNRIAVGCALGSLALLLFSCASTSEQSAIQAQQAEAAARSHAQVVSTTFSRDRLPVA